MSEGPNTQFDLFVGSQWRNCGLDPYEFTIFCNLTSHANPHSKLCCPSIRTISRETGISRRKVIYALKTLETKGFMTHVEQARADGGQAAHRYVDLAHPKRLKSEIPVPEKNPSPGACDAPTPMHMVHLPHACDARAPVHEVVHKVFNLKGIQFKGKSGADAHTHPLSEAKEEEEEVTKKGGGLLSGTDVEPPDDGKEEEEVTPEGKEGTSLRSEGNREEAETSLRSGSLKNPKTCSVTSPSPPESETVLAPAPQRCARRDRPRAEVPLPGSEAEVIAYVVSRGFPEADGKHIWKRWQGNGFKNLGQPIHDWQATIGSWADAGFLLSQKKQAEKTSKNGVRRNII
jgi:Helix-turn-helix domain